jgi:hypothetical protein
VMIVGLPSPPVIPPAPTPVSTFPATCTTYSDGTFACDPTGPVTAAAAQKSAKKKKWEKNLLFQTTQRK